MERLSSFPIGEFVQIKNIDDELYALKFLELGICPGKSVEIVRLAPSGSPLAVKVGRSIFALRKEEADHIWGVKE